MEGVAFTLVDAQAALRETGDAFARVSLIGGGAKSRFWARLIASSLGCDVVRHTGGETGPALGAARLAQVAAGADLEALASAPAIEEIIAPEPELREGLLRRHARFADLYRALRPTFAKAMR